MTEHHIVNVKLSYSQLSKLKSSTKASDITVRLSSDMVGSDKNFPYNLLLTNRKSCRSSKAFANGSSKDIKSSKTRLFKTLQLGGFHVRLFGPFVKLDLPLMKNVLTLLAKNVLVSLGLTAAASANHAGIHKKNLRIWSLWTLFISSLFNSSFKLDYTYLQNIKHQ